MKRFSHLTLIAAFACAVAATMTACYEERVFLPSKEEQVMMSAMWLLWQPRPVRSSERMRDLGDGTVVLEGPL